MRSDFDKGTRPLLACLFRNTRIRCVVLQAAEAAELVKMEAARQRALAQKAIQLQQLEDLKTRILRERAEDRREGAETKLHAEEEVEELRWVRLIVL